jgi:TadE-like protein
MTTESRSAHQVRDAKRHHGERGQTLVEFALASTLFLMIVFGLMQFGIMVFRYNMISDLAQEGARRASVCGASRVLSDTECDINAFVRGRAVGVQVDGVSTIPDLEHLMTLGGGQPVLVEVRHTFSPMTGILPRWTLTLQSRATMYTTH